MTLFPPSSMKLIAEKPGILRRRIACGRECTSDLAVRASHHCLQRVYFPAERLQKIVLSTSSPDRVQPTTAARARHSLGAINAFALHISSVCPDSTFGICMADALLKSGNSETFSSLAPRCVQRYCANGIFTPFLSLGPKTAPSFFEQAARIAASKCTERLYSSFPLPKRPKSSSRSRGKKVRRCMRSIGSSVIGPISTL